MSMLKLADISSWNGAPDLARAKRDGGLSGVYIKMTQGTGYVSQYAAVAVASAEAAGLPWGGYHFADLTVGNPEGQAQHFADTIHSMPGTPTLRDTLDHEQTGGLPPVTVAGFANVCARAMKALRGHDPLLYTYPDFVAQGCCAGLGWLDLWYARYGVPSWDAVVIPAPWTRDRFVLWQSGQTPIPGINAGDGPGVDVDWAPSLDPLLITTEADMPLNDADKQWITQAIGTAMDAAHWDQRLTDVLNSNGTQTQRILDALAHLSAGPGGPGTDPKAIAKALAAAFAKVAQ